MRDFIEKALMALQLVLTGRCLKRGERGATAAEYTIIIALIAIAIFAGLQALGGGILQRITQMTGCIVNGTGC